MRTVALESFPLPLVEALESLFSRWLVERGIETSRSAKRILLEPQNESELRLIQRFAEALRYSD